MIKKRLWFPILMALVCCLLSIGCRKEIASRSEFAMGDQVVAGPLTYNVVEKTWKSQLGETFQIREPENRFLVISLSVTNGSGSEVSLPLLQLEGYDNTSYKELEDVVGVQNWLGVIRTIQPGQTITGKIVFDVPLKYYKLKLSDGDSVSGLNYYVWLPLQIDTDAPAGSPQIDTRAPAGSPQIKK